MVGVGGRLAGGDGIDRHPGEVVRASKEQSQQQVAQVDVEKAVCSNTQRGGNPQGSQEGQQPGSEQEEDQEGLPLLFAAQVTRGDAQVEGYQTGGATRRRIRISDQTMACYLYPFSRSGVGGCARVIQRSDL